MSEYQFGITTKKPSRKDAKRFDRICKEEGGHGFTETSVGTYRGWFAGPNKGEPFDSDLKSRVLARI